MVFMDLPTPLVTNFAEPKPATLATSAHLPLPAAGMSIGVHPVLHALSVHEEIDTVPSDFVFKITDPDAKGVDE